MHKHHISFIHALDGILTAVRTQPNFRIHLTISFLALLFSYLLSINSFEWILVILVIFIGLAIELINTSIEFTVDLITQEHRLLAKYAKDTAAGAMLIYAVAAVIVGLYIFLPRILVWLSI